MPLTLKVAAWAGLAANMTEATNPLRAREGTNKRLKVRVFIGKLAQIKTINKKHKKKTYHKSKCAVISIFTILRLLLFSYLSEYTQVLSAWFCENSQLQKLFSINFLKTWLVFYLGLVAIFVAIALFQYNE